MRSEDEVKLKISYWQGAWDILNTPEIARSEKLDKRKITVQSWLAALDWTFGVNDASTVKSAEDKK
jgi:hypothetical protein